MQIYNHANQTNEQTYQENDNLFDITTTTEIIRIFFVLHENEEKKYTQHKTKTLPGPSSEK